MERKLQTIRSGTCSHPTVECTVDAKRSLHLCPDLCAGLDTAARCRPDPHRPGLNTKKLLGAGKIDLSGSVEQHSALREIKGQNVLWEVLPGQSHCESEKSWYPSINNGTSPKLYSRLKVSPTAGAQEKAQDSGQAAVAWTQ